MTIGIIHLGDSGSGIVKLELLFNALKPRPGESLLDIGCGTGFFTREMGARIKGKVVGVDINQKWIRYACQQDSDRASYAVADAGALPFSDAAFDMVISVAALCFIPDIHTAIRETIRVTRRSFAIGLLNRNSLLWLQKGRNGGRNHDSDLLYSLSVPVGIGCLLMAFKF
jgi:SAM-dependent methyltransferase